MDIKPVISADTVSPTLPEISLTTTSLTSCSTTTMATITPTLCGLCYRPIYDQYIMKVVDTFYHEQCLECCICSKRLMHSCFARNGKLYCRFDYERWVFFFLLFQCFSLEKSHSNKINICVTIRWLENNKQDVQLLNKIYISVIDWNIIVLWNTLKTATKPIWGTWTNWIECAFCILHSSIHRNQNWKHTFGVWAS